MTLGNVFCIWRMESLSTSWSCELLPSATVFCHNVQCSASPRALRNGASLLGTETSATVSPQIGFSSPKIVLFKSLSQWKSWLKQLCSLSNEHLFLAVLEARKSKIHVSVHPVSGEGPFRNTHTMSDYFRWMEGKKSFLMSLILRVLILFMRASSSWPNYITKILPPNTIPLGIRITTNEFGGFTAFSP